MQLQRALDERGVASVRVVGGSMSPTVEEGAQLLVHAGAPRVGDVVAIRAGDGVIVHRIVARLGARFVHKGDRAGALPGLCRAPEILGIVELPRRVPAWRRRARYLLTALGRVLFILAAFAGCKKKPAAEVPRVVEVRVVDRTPHELPAPDVAALTRTAARVIGASGLPVVDGGSGGFKLRVEVRLDGAEAGEKGLMRAYVVARLEPVDAPPGALTFEQGGVAEHEYKVGQLGDKTAAFRAHAQRAVEDVVRGVGARAQLARGSAADLIAALDGSDEDLREEACDVAAERKEKQAVPALIALLKNDDTAVRDRAIGALAAIGDARAVKPLTEVAQFREIGELPKVIDAVAAIGGDEARAYLEFVASGHDDPEMRRLAKEALGHLDKRNR